MYRPLKRMLALLLCAVFLLHALPAAAQEEIETLDDISGLDGLFRIYGLYMGEDDFSCYVTGRLVRKKGLDWVLDAARCIYGRWSNDAASFSEIRLDDGSRLHFFNFEIRSGIRMAEAYANGLTDRLSKDERKCLKQITKVVEKMKKKYEPDSVELERAIYDWICDRLEYEAFTGDKAHDQKISDACYAYFNGRGNCQAYSDLFYMMATMAGFEVNYVSGWHDGGKHLWNVILINGGLYMVDVTFGDTGNGTYPMPTHYYFNFGRDRAQEYTWFKEIFPTIEKKTDDSCSFYCDRNKSFGFQTRRISEAAAKCVGRVKKGQKYVEIFCRKRDYSKDDMDDAIYDALGNHSARWRSYRYEHESGVEFWIIWKEYDGRTVE